MVPTSNFHRPDITPGSNAQDILEKRRKQIERTKAANLSKQLQMCLRYARLKVEHGWQKQTLNEVENLYFHYYRGMALSGNFAMISGPTKDQLRSQGSICLHADMENDEVSSKNLPVPTDSNPSAVTPPKSSFFSIGIATDLHSVDNSQTLSSISVSEQTGESIVLTVSESLAPSAQLQEHTSHLLNGASASSALEVSTQPNTATTPETPASSTTLLLDSHSNVSQSPSIPSASPSSTPILAAKIKVKSNSIRTSSKLPIPRLHTSTYPYTIAASPGKLRKAPTAPAPGTPKPVVPSPPPLSTAASLLSPYKSLYPSYPSSTAPQNEPPVAGNPCNGTPSLPLTYDSFWSSHASSSALPLSYRANINPPASSSISSILPDLVTSISPPPSSPNFPFASSLTTSPMTNSPSNLPLPHSPVMSSLLHPPHMSLFPQTRHSPASIPNQSSQVG